MNNSDLEPVMRCDSCQALVEITSLHNLGCCPKCGNRRVRSVDVMNDEERAQVESWGHKDFLALFGEVKDA